MKQLVPKHIIPAPLAFLRHIGYSAFTDPRTGEDSFVIRVGADFYPRYHLYVEDDGQNWSFNLHIDQKKPSYNGTSKHAGEYEGPAVEKEMQRIRDWVTSLTHYQFNGEPQQHAAPPTIKPKPTSRPYGGIFG